MMDHKDLLRFFFNAGINIDGIKMHVSDKGGYSNMFTGKTLILKRFAEPAKIGLGANLDNPRFCDKCIRVVGQFEELTGLGFGGSDDGSGLYIECCPKHNLACLPHEFILEF